MWLQFMRNFVYACLYFRVMDSQPFSIVKLQRKNRGVKIIRDDETEENKRKAAKLIWFFIAQGKQHLLVFLLMIADGLRT